jgi:hypothetical protein
MDHKSWVFAVFSVLVGILLFGIWSNTYVYAQQSSSPTLSSPTGSSLSKPLLQELKAKMCDPSNPSLKVVNTTESHICGIPKTLKPSLSATPPTSPVSSSASLLPQKTTTKPTPAAANVATTPPKLQQQKNIATTNNNTISRPNSAAAGATIVSVISNLSNKPSSSSTQTIAPQANALNQQQQLQIQQLPLTTNNDTAVQNYTFASTSPAAAPGKIVFLGYNGGSISSTQSDSKGKVSTRSDSHNNNDNHDRGSKDNNKGSSDNNKSSGHKNDGSKSSSQSKDHKEHDSNGSSKGKKNSNSKGHSNHKGGDSFFGGDKFFD